MKFLLRYAVSTAILFCGVFSTPSLHGQQIHLLYKSDVAVGITGQYTPSITSQSSGPHQGTTDSPGFLLSFRDHPVSWAGIELNYQYSSFSERFVRRDANQSRVSVPLNFHEATAAYLMQRKLGRLRPFVAVGGGALYFNPSPVDVRTQLRGVGLVSLGADIPVSQHFSFRVQGRSLYYRAPNFNDVSLSTSRWVATVEPSASYVLHW